MATAHEISLDEILEVCEVLRSDQYRQQTAQATEQLYQSLEEWFRTREPLSFGPATPATFEDIVAYFHTASVGP